MKEVVKRLMKVQLELKAPKGQKNTFGKYNYRSCEDILEVAKPLCIENGLLLLLHDDMVQIGDRVYVKATAQVIDEEGNAMKTEAFARESLTKKGMDDSQITGTASSYARKYALNGLFCIDDTKDADTDQYTKQTAEKKEKFVGDKKIDELITLAASKNINAKQVASIIAKDYSMNMQEIGETVYNKVKARLEKA